MGIRSAFFFSKKKNFHNLEPKVRSPGLTKLQLTSPALATVGSTERAEGAAASPVRPCRRITIIVLASHS